MKSFFKIVLATFVAICLFIVLILIIISLATSDEPQIKRDSFLVIDYEDELYEYAPAGGIEAKILGAEPETLNRILINLKKAAVDKKIKGVIFRIHGAGGGYGMLEEIRQAIKAFQVTEKKVYAFATTMSRKALFLASACDSIFMPPTGYFTFTGFNSERFYIKNMLEKIGLKVNLHKIKDYKSAAEMIQEEEMTSYTREMTQWMLDQIWDIYMEAVTTDRELTTQDVETAMRQAIFSVEEAREAKLIDEILYWDQLEARLKLPDDKKLRLVSQSDYAKIDPAALDLGGKQKIAVIHAQGIIGGRQSGANPVLGVMMGYQSVMNDLRRAQFDDDIAAVIFRVNSNGGDHLTSDLICRQVGVVAQEKPLVVSMVDVAASGGYTISYHANKLVANASTVTGSIGSITATFNAKELYHKLGITKDFITKGPDTFLNTDYRDLTNREWRIWSDNHQDSYQQWLADIAQRRQLTIRELEKLADGRVWTGRQAKANGLIDEIGGLERAIAIAKELAQIPAEEKVTLVHYPEAKSLAEMILSSGETSQELIDWVLFDYIQNEIPNRLNELSRARLMYWDGELSQ